RRSPIRPGPCCAQRRWSPSSLLCRPRGCGSAIMPAGAQEATRPGGGAGGSCVTGRGGAASAGASPQHYRRLTGRLAVIEPYPQDILLAAAELDVEQRIAVLAAVVVAGEIDQLSVGVLEQHDDAVGGAEGLN